MLEEAIAYARSIRLKAGCYVRYKGTFVAHIIQNLDDEGYVKETYYEIFKNEQDALATTLDDKEPSRWKGY